MAAPYSESDGTRDVSAAAEALADRIPEELRALATLAYNYWWSWAPGGEELFQSVAPRRWERCGFNPVRLLEEVTPARLRALASSPSFVERVHGLKARFQADMKRQDASMLQTGRPVAFLCAEFGVHSSLPFYAGGLGVLAGDFLKEASDQAAPVIGVGLFYTEGSFHQQLDVSGWQHEYWLETDSDRLPAVQVRGGDALPLTIRVPIHGREVAAHIWRVDVGRVPLYLLDANHPDNSPADRWISARLYVGNRDLRLAQYALLGIGGVRALRAMGFEPSLLHLNEGHAALALVELMREHLAAGETLEDAKANVAAQTRFTTHTPVAAGNESFDEGHIRAVLPDLSGHTGLDWPELMALARVRPEDGSEPFGLTPLALRLAGASNGVSRLHGSVARSMWQSVWPDRGVDEIPIAHITNGVHRPTWMAPEMASLVNRFVPDWGDDGAWDGVMQIPDEEIWAVRQRLRSKLAAFVRERSVGERLGRGASVAYSESAADLWNDETLTIGFARRIATYKRLYLITRDPERGLRMIDGERPVQLLIAGRAHPQDDEAKRTVQQVFALNELPNAAGRVVFLEDHDMNLAARLVQGCDLWVNLPRALQEASGTSGMKSVLNGGLQLSVLDGWWAEAYRPGTGWAIDSDPGLSPEDQDGRDTAALFDLLEHEVLPMFYERDDRGIPVRWVQWIRESLRVHGPAFSATRMFREYARLDEIPL